ncbi:glycosyltransferase [Aeoliella sp. ICT_H6.2]|uniref:Glycosyltransferase n=1 Tax=Aeoliella straminimaris TaxID=2954799 RepID=A0A9X2FHC6_9BACT|nr:glycosyltransferase [Aeoliella straminimaris]MCO6044731.1 glycosyltransferase [Aeoliella straminimaris]
MSTLLGTDQRIRCAGKYFTLDDQRWAVQGFSYGPFPPRSDGQFLPELNDLRRDLQHIASLNGNCIRVYHPPSRELLDEALRYGIRVFVDVPWEKHRCFFEDWEGRRNALEVAGNLARDLGNHPGLFAISVGNEIPADIIRFQSRHKVAQFVTQLLDTVKQEAPDCLTTYVSYPTTEFFQVSECDFVTLNVYLDDEAKLGAYIDRLQHIAGNRPLLLGEYGSDCLRGGEQQQAERLEAMVRQCDNHGVSGAFVFAYTDEWFTGGKLIDDWQFGVTRADRSEKPAAHVLRQKWSGQEEIDPELPGVSVVVCSYNGGTTLEECLHSLMALEYPDYEVILVDDGSTDNSRAIAEQFPQINYYYQANKGLSVARNVGAEIATKDVVAYTDSDCVVTSDWLRKLMTAMRAQNVQAIGGPNITPPSDGWVAKCVAASPGNPSHVMLNDQLAEHVPGCNMAFQRAALLNMGGFDPQFRQAGDDVDICWRFLDSGMQIGYASGAMVWHKRRSTVKAYGKQQSGYGRSEALVIFKHPQRCDLLGQAIWKGIIYGDGAVGLPLASDLIYHGQFGNGLFQLVYRHNRYAPWSIAMSLAWHLVALYVLLLALLFPPLALVAIAMELATVVLCVRSAISAPLGKSAPWWCRPLVAYLYWVQPILRGWHRTTHLLKIRKVPRHPVSFRAPQVENERTLCKVEKSSCYAHWDNRSGRGRTEMLHALVNLAKRGGWKGDFENAWADWDVKLLGDLWHHITVRTATEELGWPRRFTRARCDLRKTQLSQVIAVAIAIWLICAAISMQYWAMGAGLVAAATYWLATQRSRRMCLSAVASLVTAAGDVSGLSADDDFDTKASKADLEPVVESWVRLEASSHERSPAGKVVVS